MKLHLLHPAAVHFPIALLVTGFAARLAASLLGERGERFRNASSCALDAGAISAWAALILGLLAEDSAPHVPSAWEVQALHERLAWATALLATLLAAWRHLRPEAAPRAFLAVWAALAGLTLWTAREGGRLVYEHGVGTALSEPM